MLVETGRPANGLTGIVDHAVQAGELLHQMSAQTLERAKITQVDAEDLDCGGVGGWGVPGGAMVGVVRRGGLQVVVGAGVTCGMIVRAAFWAGGWVEGGVGGVAESVSG